MGVRPQGEPPPIPAPEFPPLADVPGVVDPLAAIALSQIAEAEKARATAQPLSVTEADADDLRRLTVELARRRIEALKLYEPLPEQAKFHGCRSRVRLMRGSNRAGKTLCSAVEVARALTGQDPHKKYPDTDGLCFAVGKDQKHIGQVLYPKLFRPRAFKIIRDEETGVWRAFRPWVEADLARANEAKPAPPLIPPRFIADIAWENKKENVPSKVTLTTGWEIMFFSSLGKPPQGSAIDVGWLDEEIVDASWFPELSARILDRVGCLIWSATPQAGTDQLYELHEQAEKEHEQQIENPTVSEFVVLLDENPHMTEQAKRDFANTLSEEERRVRIGGEFAMASFKVYPEFHMHIQGVDYREIPKTWTRYMAVDPGHQICAALFAAVPPPDEGDFVYLYDELYIPNCNAAMFAATVKQKVANDDFYAFVIDAHMGIHTELGVGQTVGEQYAAALRAENVRSRMTGSNFILGSDNVLAGINAVHSWMRIRPDGTTKMRVLRGALPNLEWELKRYHKKRVAGIVTDMPNQRKNNHACDSLRYLCMLDPKYVAPNKGKPPRSGAAAEFDRKREKRRAMAGGSAVHLGPGSGRY